MKTIEQVQQEIEYGDIFTLEEFCQMLEDGGINFYDGHGYFYDGESETNISVFDEGLLWDDVKDFPYVCWYNK